MSLEIMSTAAAIGTFIVIAATAITAVVQLRQLARLRAAAKPAAPAPITMTSASMP
jgi:hypothetical protein